MTTGAPAVELRSAGHSDYGFFARVYASTRGEELAGVPWSPDEKAVFLAQQFAAQSAHYAEHYPDATYEMVIVGGEPAGRLIVARLEGEVRIVDISLLPECRSRGVGTMLLGRILDEADAAAAKVSVHVERLSRARSLYERLGFRDAADAGVYVRMERPPRI